MTPIDITAPLEALNAADAARCQACDAEDRVTLRRASDRIADGETLPDADAADVNDACRRRGMASEVFARHVDAKRRHDDAAAAIEELRRVANGAEGLRIAAKRAASLAATAVRLAQSLKNAAKEREANAGAMALKANRQNQLRAEFPIAFDPNAEPAKAPPHDPATPSDAEAAMLLDELADLESKITPTIFSADRDEDDALAEVALDRLAAIDIDVTR